MTRFTRKVKVLIIVSLAVIIAIGSAFVHLYKEKVYWQEDAAQYNHYHWEELNLMASTIENIGFTKEGITEIYPYIKAKVFSCTAGLYPAFNGDAAYTSVLQTYYVSLAQDIMYSQDLTDEKLQEAIDIFKDATLTLKELTMDILKMSEQEKDKVALRKVGSPIYNDAEKMIKEYCNKYGKMISEFNHSYERTTRNIVIDKEFSNDGITVDLNHIKLSSKKTVVVCTIKTDSEEIPLNHMESYIKGRVVKYQYLQGEGNAVNGHTEYVLEFEPLYSESSIELYIELKSGEKITIPVDLTAY